jgi:putative PIN family toxin of toxin-antitoxin system
MSGHVCVIFDTYVFLKALGQQEPHRDAMEHFMKVSHTMRYSTEILNEYKSKTSCEGMTVLFLLRKVMELERSGKLKKIKVTLLEQSSELIRDNHCQMPNDRYDDKFVVAAIACKARFVVTTDNGMLDLNPYRCDRVGVEFIEPASYQTR